MLAFVLPSLFLGLPLLGWAIAVPWLGLAAGALFVPAGEWLTGSRTLGPALRSVWLMRLIILAVIAQIPLLALLASGSTWVGSAPEEALGVADLLFLGLSVGYVSGGIGIVLAHELGHRRDCIDLLLSRLLLLLVFWGPYRSEHNRGHHRRAATPEDPASAKPDESLYRFMWRYFPGIYRCAFSLGQAVQTDPSKSQISARKVARGWASEAATLSAGSVLAVALLGALGGWQAVLFVLIQAAVALYLVCAVDYVEHWGLQRARKGSRWERMGPAHTWDCANGLSDLLLFQLPRHAHHHIAPGLAAHRLERTPESPQMPTGYAGMVVLASVPPLWFAVMNPRLGALRKEGSFAPSRTA
jgi:alkane 1-monooxygenase